MAVRVLGVKDFADTRESIDVGDRLVRPQTQDSREAQGETAVVAFRALNIVKGDFQDDGGLDIALEPAVFGGVIQEVLGEFANLDVGQARIGFADVDQAAVVAHGKGVVGKQTTAFAVTVFGDSDDDIESGQRALELHPELAATARDVGRLRSLGEEPFIAGVEGQEEAIFDFVDRAAEFGAGELQAGLFGFGQLALEEQAALGERSVQEGATVQQEQVEGDKTDWNLGRSKEVDLLAAQALLEFGEGDGAAVAPSDDFAIQDKVAGNSAEGLEKFGEFSDAVQGAGIDLDL